MDVSVSRSKFGGTLVYFLPFQLDGMDWELLNMEQMLVPPNVLVFLKQIKKENIAKTNHVETQIDRLLASSSVSFYEVKTDF